MGTIIKDNYKFKEPTAVAIGNFDGVHIGHQTLINNMIKGAQEKKLKPGVLSFYNHTETIINNGKGPKYLTDNMQKIDILNKMNIDFLCLLNFNDEIMKLSPDEFVNKILLEKLNVKLVVIGFNFRFGYKAQGDGQLLKQMGKEYGFEVKIISPVVINNKIVSSTYIRKLINEGNIEEANYLLGRPYTIKGEVVSGKGRGKGMGVPTANIKLSTKYVIPRYGVYETWTNIDNNMYLSITNVGKNPTFDEDYMSIETHIIDFSDDIYNKNIEVSFTKFIRDERKFSSKDELIKQMNKDINLVKMNNKYLQRKGFMIE